MQRSYELFTIVISPYISDLVVPELSASVLPGFYYHISQRCCCPSFLKRWSVACVHTASVLEKLRYTLPIYIFSEQNPQVLRGWLRSSLWLMKPVPLLFLTTSPILSFHLPCIKYWHNILRALPVSSAFISCFHWAACIEFCLMVLVIDCGAMCDVGLFLREASLLILLFCANP